MEPLRINSAGTNVISSKKKSKKTKDPSRSSDTIFKNKLSKNASAATASSDTQTATVAIVETATKKQKKKKDPSRSSDTIFRNKLSKNASSDTQTATVAIVETATKKPKKKKEKQTGCKKCGMTDHIRSTIRQCPSHPNYKPRKRRLSNSSYDLPAGMLCGPGLNDDDDDNEDDDDDSEDGESDYSGKPGYRCDYCNRRSENVGPRRGYDYKLNVCGGCC